MSQLDVVVVGELNVDLILQDLNSFPEMGKEKIARNMILTMGSASAILACNIARLGVKVGFIGQLGKDSYANIVLGALQERGVDTGGVIQSDDALTGVTVAMSFPEDYAMVTYMGAMETFGISGVDFDYLTKARHMHLSSYYLQPAMRKDCVELFRRAKEAGMTTSLDPGWDPEEVWSDDILTLLPDVDLLLPNEHEAMNIAHKNTIDEALVKLGRYSPNVVITLGSDGTVCSSGDQTYRTKTYNVTPVDTTGAGDSFNSGFIYRWLQGAETSECLRAGSACGALAVTRLGGITASPTPSELISFLSEHTEDIFVS
ncbi:carbohydrate kinase family protein [Candidatus Neomarinimicrobiota bacterium]